MPKPQFVLFVSLMALMLSSCGGVEALIGPSEILHEIPSEMFYQTKGDCAQGDLSFSVLVAAGTQMWTDPSAVLHSQQELYLHSNHTFDMRYREFTLDDVAFDTRLQSRFSIDGHSGRVKLNGVGEGFVIQDNGRRYLQLQFTQAVNSPELVGKTARFRIMNSMTGLDTDRAEYCGYSLF